MKKDNLLLAIIGVLAVVIIMQWLFLPKRKPARRPAPAPKEAPAVAVTPAIGRIAIVIDDWGNHVTTLPIVSKMRVPMTASVLPNLRYSAEVSRKLHSYGFEIILHLPMEPREKYKLEKNTITTDLGARQIQEIIGRDLESLVYADGVSNHMGSKATSDLKTMRVVLSELKKRGLYFLDSFVISKSVVRQVAQEIGLPTARRDVFLDNKNDAVYIKEQIKLLKNKARKNGYAVGIGHDRAKTLEVLAEVIPQLKKEGYVFVTVSELVD